MIVTLPSPQTSTGNISFYNKEFYSTPPRGLNGNWGSTTDKNTFFFPSGEILQAIEDASRKLFTSPSASVIEASRNVLSLLKRKNITSLRLFPLPEGGIEFVFKKEVSRYVLDLDNENDGVFFERSESGAVEMFNLDFD